MREDCENIQWFCDEHAPKPIGYKGDLSKLIGGFVKMCFTDGEKQEHMWVKVASVGDGCVVGPLCNEPVNVQNVKYGDGVLVTREEIEEVQIYEVDDERD